jgi:hypothetical protein
MPQQHHRIDPLPAKSPQESLLRVWATVTIPTTHALKDKAVRVAPGNALVQQRLVERLKNVETRKGIPALTVCVFEQVSLNSPGIPQQSWGMTGRI